VIAEVNVTPQIQPLRLIVMGVSGSGKSTLAAALSERMGLRMVDGDDLHLPESVEKMRSGIALEDADRWPWLDRIGHVLAACRDHPGVVVACSALRRAYRDRIRQQSSAVRFLFLDGSFELIEERLRLRVGHYMRAELLHSQFRTLERPGPEEVDVLALRIDRPVAELVATATQRLVGFSPMTETPDTQRAPTP
jgi:carbohydrate kinase (thermoresistant glucokinase family)